jgi:hypothetical protein
MERQMNYDVEEARRMGMRGFAGSIASKKGA